MLDLDAIADVVAGAVREATAPLLARIDALEKRELVLPEKGDTGPQGEQGPAGEVDMQAVRALIDEAVATLPPAEKGEPGEPGRDVDMSEVGQRIEVAVKSAVAALPAPKDGAPGKDGAGLADALKDAEGNLVLVMTDGRTKSLGKIDGKDGVPGRDGLGFNDLNVEQIGERTVRFLLKRDADEAEFDVTFPVPIYRDVFKEGAAYERGDMVTWGGSLWHCDKATTDKPSPDSWTLAAKKGRDGKDAGK
jgi:hypothetical protein